ncbi:hypothetical protein [Jiella marina]|uniref:hypothetical protein n=1 Tax=Jiella sp. LLJ827 TaxID=2917712 RepID=UPI00210116C7|nr:hypothetical protein [Jiella sp. LLJ827]MCQ0987656.1 hypothetical protein [Jiella sp. LLJ827]
MAIPASRSEVATEAAGTTGAAGVSPCLIFGVVTIAALAFQIGLVFVHEINWDEFYFLARAAAFNRGELTSPLQTFHVQLFAWLAALPLSGIDRIVIGRLIMFACEIGTLAAIFRIARQHASAAGAMAAVAAYAASSNVLVHGASFRFDPLATCLLMTALALIWTGRITVLSAGIAAIAVAVAGLVTVKSVFFVPAILAAAFFRLADSGERRAVLLRFITGGIVGAASFALLFLLHRASLGEVAAEAAPSNRLGQNIATMFSLGGFPWTGRYLLRSMVTSFLLWGGIAAGTALVLARLSPGSRARGLALLALTVPLLSIFVYRNSFPYYYVFALAPAAVLCALAYDAFAERLSSPLPLAAGLLLPPLVAASSAYSAGQTAQRETLTAIHEIFPEPVAYIDRNGSVTDYPRLGFFMSTLGTSYYRQRGRPEIRQAIAERHPRFVLANGPGLSAALDPDSPALPDGLSLLPEDAQALRTNFVHHWGSIWVAGKTISIQPGDFQATTEIVIPGPYTLEAEVPLVIDGAILHPGEVREFVVGSRTIGRHAGTGDGQGGIKAILRYGANLPRPAKPAPSDPFFVGFSG